MPSLNYVAVLLGALFLVSRLPGIFFPKDYAKFIKELLKNELQLRMFMVLPFLFALTILLQKYDFTREWETVMSVLGWLILIVSLKIMWWPKHVAKKLEGLLKSDSLVALVSLVGASLGIFLIYLGFYVY